ncbi:ELP4 [[Candida] subhashii]|uniref:ELP4 n=1 Tax=[Candida] subhashii TaxID=561895 RepID=A0A8J5UDY6_9ASCO|nr:ELP4 [[Candida] subhashii]KAG7660693.1 ELP4 [[Candida] subhashii]
MSFRKRGDVIGGAPTANRPSPGSTIPGRSPGPMVPGRSPVPAPIPGRSIGVVPGRAPGSIPSSVAGRLQTRGSQTPEVEETNEQEITNLLLKNPGIRPSLISSQPTTSTGTADLDKRLLHQGLPIGHSLLVEESGTTDFSSVLLRAFASQGIVHNRVSDSGGGVAHVIVIGMSPQWSNELPGLYKGSSKEQKKKKILENESKVSVSNLSNAPTTGRIDPSLKIAWRYGLNKKPDSSESVEGTGGSSTAYENYNHQFDITTKLTPGPNPQDISYVPIGISFNKIIIQITSIIKTQIKSNPAKVIRIVIPGLLNPSLYHPTTTSSTFIFPFIHSLRALLRQYHNNLVLMCSIPLDLYPRETNLLGFLETLFDSVIHLQPFNQEMTQLLERAYKNEPSKVQQGLVNIIKLPILSEKGLMMIHDGEYAFKNGRKKFEIEEWGIPVEDDDGNKDENSTPEGGKTTKNIDF